MQNMQLDKEMISATLLGDFQGIGELFLESPNRHAMQIRMEWIRLKLAQNDDMLCYDHIFKFKSVI